MYFTLDEMIRIINNQQSNNEDKIQVLYTHINFEEMLRKI